MNAKAFFKNDSPFMNGVYKFNLLVGLNLLVLLCCIPVVTAGAALTAMHGYLLKLREDTEGAMLKSFFSLFRKNFKQATLAWLLFLGVFTVIGADVIICVETEFTFPLIIKILFIEITILIFAVFCYCFPMIASFQGTLSTILKDAFFMGAGMIKKTIIIMLAYLLPWAILFLFPLLGWITVLIGITGPAYLASCLYGETIKQIKEKIKTQNHSGEDSYP